jgi:nicotinamide-nucleotide amidase
MQSLIIEVGKQLTARAFKLATAESCTGGGVAYQVTEIAGSSDWFDRGFVTYSNLAKIEMLGIPQSLLDTYGAVSEQTAHAMAEGALSHSQAQVSLAITGIAGPGGGSATKPVGTVWFGWAGINIDTHTTVKLFKGNRSEIRAQSIQFALDYLLTILGSVDR